jgi:putative RNA 2'-phosphotransferase
MDFNERMSKRMSYILRHAPWVYELELDEEGWTSLDQLIEGLRTENGMEGIGRGDIEAMLASSSKARFEIDGDRIRAYYGHSLPGRIVKRLAVPPEHLYHGTVRRFIPAIRESGLKPMSRQYVHLSRDLDMANTVARRRGSDIVILTIAAGAASEAGVRFYEESNGVWLADEVPPEWIGE